MKISEHFNIFADPDYDSQFACLGEDARTHTTVFKFAQSLSKHYSGFATRRGTGFKEPGGSNLVIQVGAYWNSGLLEVWTFGEDACKLQFTFSANGDSPATIMSTRMGGSTFNPVVTVEPPTYGISGLNASLIVQATTIPYMYKLQMTYHLTGT